MLYLFSVRRHYTTLLPPTAVRRRLEHVISPRSTGGWKRFFWRLGFWHPPCWGEVQPDRDEFMARLPTHRTDGPIVHGQWQAVAPGADPLAGTSVQLAIQLPLSERIFGAFLVGLLGVVCLQSGVFTHPAQAPLIPIGMLFLFTLLVVLTGLWSIRHATRYFQQALALSRRAD